MRFWFLFAVSYSIHPVSIRLQLRDWQILQSLGNELQPERELLDLRSIRVE